MRMNTPQSSLNSVRRFDMSDKLRYTVTNGAALRQPLSQTVGFGAWEENSAESYGRTSITMPTAADLCRI